MPIIAEYHFAPRRKDLEDKFSKNTRGRFETAEKVLLLRLQWKGVVFCRGRTPGRPVIEHKTNKSKINQQCHYRLNRYCYYLIIWTYNPLALCACPPSDRRGLQTSGRPGVRPLQILKSIPQTENLCGNSSF